MALLLIVDQVAKFVPVLKYVQPVLKDFGCQVVFAGPALQVAKLVVQTQFAQLA